MIVSCCGRICSCRYCRCYCCLLNHKINKLNSNEICSMYVCMYARVCLANIVISLIFNKSSIHCSTGSCAIVITMLVCLVVN
jgi:hypothetical protein